jgi:hypothetical protein
MPRSPPPTQNSCPPASPCPPPHLRPISRLGKPSQAYHPGPHQALLLLLCPSEKPAQMALLLFHACHPAPSPKSTRVQTLLQQLLQQLYMPSNKAAHLLHHAFFHIHRQYYALERPLRPATGAFTRPCCCSFRPATRRPSHPDISK